MFGDSPFDLILTLKIKLRFLQMQSSYSSPFRGSASGSSAHVDRLVTGIFRDLSTNETLVSAFSSVK